MRSPRTPSSSFAAMVRACASRTDRNAPATASVDTTRERADVEEESGYPSMSLIGEDWVPTVAQ
jgi:hypothetical protein